MPFFADTLKMNKQLPLRVRLITETEKEDWLKDAFIFRSPCTSTLKPDDMVLVVDPVGAALIGLGLVHEIGDGFCVFHRVWITDACEIPEDMRSILDEYRVGIEPLYQYRTFGLWALTRLDEGKEFINEDAILQTVFATPPPEPRTSTTRYIYSEEELLADLPKPCEVYMDYGDQRLYATIDPDNMFIPHSDTLPAMTAIQFIDYGTRLLYPERRVIYGEDILKPLSCSKGWLADESLHYLWRKVPAYLEYVGQEHHEDE